MRAEVYGIPRPAYAYDPKALAAEAAKIKVPLFVPRKGVQVETDPKVWGGRKVASIVHQHS